MCLMLTWLVSMKEKKIWQIFGGNSHHEKRKMFALDPDLLTTYRKRRGGFMIATCLNKPWILPFGDFSYDVHTRFQQKAKSIIGRPFFFLRESKSLVFFKIFRLRFPITNVFYITIQRVLSAYICVRPRTHANEIRFT